MSNRTESNFQQYKPVKKQVVCRVCGLGNKQLFRTTPKEKGKHIETNYICVDCK